jgi:hypothetical protein
MKTHPVLWVVAAIVGLGVVITAYIVLGPRPTDFAGGKFVALSAYRDADPTGVATELKSASLVERGEYLTRAADCEVCHTAENGTPFAGGLAFVLPFGTIYSTNITPDVETGIGSYTDANFLDAVRKGIGRGHAKLYPARCRTPATPTCPMRTRLPSWRICSRSSPFMHRHRRIPWHFPSISAAS